LATAHKQKKIVSLLLNIFNEKEKDKLIKYVMMENEDKFTVLHIASYTRFNDIVTLLLNVFDTDQNEQLIQYVNKETKHKNTALQIASRDGSEEIVASLLNVFGKDKNIEFLEYLMKKNEHKYTALDFATKLGYKKIVQLLSQKQTNAINEIILFDLQIVTQMFNKQNKDQKYNSLLWYLFENNRCGPAKETILKFLITEYSRDIHII